MRCAFPTSTRSNEGKSHFFPPFSVVRSLVQELLIDLGELPPQARPAVADAHGGISESAAAGALRGVIDRCDERHSQRPLIVRWYQPACLAVADDLTGSMGRDGDRGQSTGHPLDEHL